MELVTVKLILKYDPAADAAYIHLVNRSLEFGEVERTELCDTGNDDTDVNLDFSSSNRLVGIELLGVSCLIPSEVLTSWKQLTD
jgi:uncharacterized protein YuzE